MKRYNNIRLITAFTLFMALLASCKKLIDVDAKDVLEEKKMYRNVFDADAAIIGLYGKFLTLAESYVVLNELRADLLTTTNNADENLRELNQHEVREGNIYANPKPYYDVILNCNDMLHNFSKMLADKTLNQTEYNMRYADVASLRAWVYLQLGIHYGNIPYITQHIPDVTSLETLMSSNAAKPIPFSALLDSLIKTQESLAYLEPYAAGSDLITTIDGYSTAKFFINKQVMLGELYLWRGQGNDYNKAATALKQVMETGGTGDFFTYRITGASKGDNNDIAVGYVRYNELNENSLINNNSQGWRSIFARAEDRLFGYEWIWYLPYNSLFKPQNPFTKLFTTGFLVKPSQQAIDNWDAQVQKNDFPYDARGRKFSYAMAGNEPQVMKYAYNANTEKWFLYRAAALHLAFAEAANRDGHHTIANALVNQGIQPTLGNRIINEGGAYLFDARKSDNPQIAADWYLNAGLRGRANLYTVPVTTDSTIAIENMIVEEAALELAFEGRRWSDLVRIALRRNDPSFLADKVYEKLRKQNNPAAATVRAKLMNKENWYLPFKW
ncbi:MAG: RagB/SusD family nutrient uptake outer membrane protein [Niabella sp.]